MIGIDFRRRLLSGQISNKEEHLFTFFVSLLCMTVYLASDIFLPSLPEMTEYFRISIAAGQSVISIFMVGLSSSQILHGLLADRFGKKTILLIVLPIFLLSTLGCILSPSIHTLVICRLFQALAASACIVIGRSLFTDLFEPYRAQRAFAVLVPLVSLSPAIAPAIGGLLALHFDWRASFIFVLIFGIFVSAFVLFYLPESKPPEKRTKSIHIHTIFISLLKMLTNIEYLKALVTLFMTINWWFYVAGAPVMFHKLGFTQDVIGILYFPVVLPYIVSSFIGRKMLKAKKPQQIYSSGNKFLLIVSFVMPLFALSNHLNTTVVVIATLFITFSNGLMFSMSMIAGIEQFKNQSGLAAGLLGTFQLFSGAVASFMIGLAGDKYNLEYYAWFVFVTTLVCYSVYMLLCLIPKRLNS